MPTFHNIAQSFRGFIFLLLLCPIALSAQVLYEISGNSASEKSYLLATNQYVDMVFLDTIPNVYTCFTSCSKVITEFALKDFETLATLRQAAVLPDSVKMKNCFSQADYQRIDQGLQTQLQMGLDQLCRMKPAYLTQMVRDAVLTKWMEYEPERTMENLLLSVAEEKNIPVIGLDDLGETMFMQFDREPFNWQCQQLVNIVDYPEREVKLERELRSMYLMGRLSDMAFLLQSPDNLSTLSYSDYQVFVRRNMTWAKRLQPYLTEGKVFIMLDAIYVGGDEGLISQLRKTGYRVRAVNR